MCVSTADRTLTRHVRVVFVSAGVRCCVSIWLRERRVPVHTTWPLLLIVVGPIIAARVIEICAIVIHRWQATSERAATPRLSMAVRCPLQSK